jgi:hypothetical protein
MGMLSLKHPSRGGVILIVAMNTEEEEEPWEEY